MANALTRVFNKVIGRAAPGLPVEGEYRPGPYYLPVTGGWLGHDAGQFMNWWQLGYNVVPATARSAIVEACVSAYAQTVAMCPGDHWLANDKGGRDRVTTSALSRVLRHPNEYQSISDFLLNATRSLYLDGNAYALCLRNDRYEIDELHLMNPRECAAQVAVTGEIFYTLGGNIVVDKLIGRLPPVPARDVLHVRLHSTTNPLRGESPLMSAALDIAAGDAIKAQQLAFYLNSAKPSIVLTTDLILDKDQVTALRDRWNEQTRGGGAGGTPILTGGLKPYPITMTGRDAQIADVMKMTREDIALAFRIPMQILGLGGAPHGSAEVLMSEWIASGLGFCLNHIEESFGLTFGLYGQPDEYVEFDTAALLRSLFKDRIDAYARAVQGGILSPNEARNLEQYPDVKYGDEPRVQQQVVPLSFAAQAAGGPPTSAPGKLKIPPAPPAPPAPSQPGVPLGSKPDARTANARELLGRAIKFERRTSTA